MKKIVTLTICLLLSVFLLTGCGKKNGTTNTSNQAAKPSKGNCDIFTCIEKASTDAKLEDINKLIGFDGELLREGSGWNTYEWKLNDEDSVEVTFYSTSTTIKINFNDDRIKNSKVDFSKYSEVKAALNSGISYDEVKAKFGGVDGTLVEKSSSGNKYRWVKTTGEYLNGSFNKDKTKCSMIIGRIQQN